MIKPKSKGRKYRGTLERLKSKASDFKKGKDQWETVSKVTLFVSPQSIMNAGSGSEVPDNLRMTGVHVYDAWMRKPCGCEVSTNDRIITKAGKFEIRSSSSDARWCFMKVVETH